METKVSLGNKAVLDRQARQIILNAVLYQRQIFLRKPGKCGFIAVPLDFGDEVHRLLLR